MVICDNSKIAKKSYNGAPDMIIKILSPATHKKDKILKKQKYEQYGVREYWIVDPETKFVDVYVLVNGKYIVNSYSEVNPAPVMVLPGCEINFTELFAPLEKSEEEKL